MEILKPFMLQKILISEAEKENLEVHETKFGPLWTAGITKTLDEIQKNHMS